VFVRLVTAIVLYMQLTGVWCLVTAIVLYMQLTVVWTFGNICCAVGAADWCVDVW